MVEVKRIKAPSDILVDAGCFDINAHWIVFFNACLAQQADA
jgi:hypothetical protein